MPHDGEFAMALNSDWPRFQYEPFPYDQSKLSIFPMLHLLVDNIGLEYLTRLCKAESNLSNLETYLDAVSKWKIWKVLRMQLSGGPWIQSLASHTQKNKKAKTHTRHYWYSKMDASYSPHVEMRCKIIILYNFIYKCL